MTNLASTLSIFSILLTICGILGGIVAFRNGFTRTANEIQERVINALEIELEHLRQRLDDLKEENTRLKLTIDTICAALKSRDMAVTIEGDMVSIRDSSGSKTTTRIQESEQETCPQ
jgi:regulator of replication initiation timing